MVYWGYKPGKVFPFLLILLAACVGREGGSSAAVSTSPAESVPESFAPTLTLPSEPPTVEAIVGSFRANVPSSDTFLLRGTLPLPPKTFPHASALRSFGFRLNGLVIPAQVEIVSRYPGVDEGAELVELLARVPKDASKSAGSKTEYEIVQLAYSPSSPPPADTIDELMKGALKLPPSLLKMVSTPGAVLFRAKDVFGNVYFTEPLHGSDWTVTKMGRATVQVRTSGRLLPVKKISGSQGTLPQLLGIHAYISGFDQENTLLMDVRFHNAVVSNPMNPDPMPKVYFRSLEMIVPKGWTALQAFRDVNLGEPITKDTHTILPLVLDDPSGAMHVLGPRAQFHRRLAIAPIEDMESAKFLLEEQGRGFVRPGISPDGGDLYSWWNPKTATYFAQNSIMPKLDFANQASLESQLAGSFQKLADAVATGTPLGDPYQGPHGAQNPEGIKYGGGTGGGGISPVNGIRTAWVGSHEGYRRYQLLHRMATDRQPVALYLTNGEHARIADFLVPTSTGGVYPIYNSSKTFFGPQAVNAHILAVESQGKKPPYEDSLLAYHPYDDQHITRYTRNARVLAYLGNDSLAKDDLRMIAEMWRLWYHPYADKSNGGASGGWTMGGHMDLATKYPNKGIPFHREHAWGQDSMSTYYGLASDSWRAEALHWFDKQIDLLELGQAGCGNGGIMAYFNEGKMLKGYRSQQTFETCYILNGLRGVRESVYRGADALQTQRIDGITERLAKFLTGPMTWPAGQQAPWYMTGIGPESLAEPVFCDSLPADAHGTNFESGETWVGLYIGLALTQDSSYFDKAVILGGGSVSTMKNLLQKSTDPNELQNNGQLLGLLQSWGWSMQGKP